MLDAKSPTGLRNERLEVVRRDQALMPCPEVPRVTRFCLHTSVAGIAGCVLSELRSESWLLPASMGDVVAGERRRADRNLGRCRGRSAPDGLIVLAGQRHPATLAIAPCAPHLGHRVTPPVTRLFGWCNPGATATCAR